MSQSGVLTVQTSGAPVVETLTGNSGGPVAPDGSHNINILGNNASGINVVGNPGTHTLSVVAYQATTAQQGTVFLATNAQATARTDTFNALTSSNIPYFGQITLYVVDANGSTPYTTIQSAINAANAAGGGQVWVRPGTYIENLTFYSGIQLSSPSEQSVTIIGTHTPPASGTLNIDRLTLQSAADIFNSAAAGSTVIIIEDCTISVTNGYTFNLPNWTGALALYDMGESSTNNGVVNNSGGATCFFVSVSIGSGTGNTMITSGPVILEEANVGCPWNAQTGSNITCYYNTFIHTVTCSNNSTGFFDWCIFSTGANQAFTMSSSGSIQINQSIVNSSNNPSIGGAGGGTLTLSDITFLNNSTLAGTLILGNSSIYPVKMSNGQLLIGSAGQAAVPATLTAGTGISITNGAGTITVSNTGTSTYAYTSVNHAASPYTVLGGDEYIGVDSTAGVVSILLPNAPSTGRVFVIKDSKAQAVANNITITTVGGVVTIDGATSYVMKTNYQSVELIFNGTSYEVF